MLMQKLKTFMAGMAIQCREKRQEQRRKAIASVSEKDAEEDVQKIMAEFHQNVKSSIQEIKQNQQEL